MKPIQIEELMQIMASAMESTEKTQSQKGA